MQNDSINTSILVNHAYGLGSPARREFVQKALQEDVDLRIRYEGILQLMKDYPGEDPEELLDNMAADIKKQVAEPVREPVLAQGRLRSIPPAAPRRTRVIPVWIKWAAAAVLVVVLSVPVYNLITKNSTPSSPYLAENKTPQYLAQQIAEMPVGIETEKGGGPVALWKEDFRRKDYAAVISKLGAADSLSHEEQYYLGLSYLKIKPARLDDAQAAFRKAIASGILFRSDAWLNLGATQVLNGAPRDAENSLKNSENPHALELLARLRK